NDPCPMLRQLLAAHGELAQSWQYVLCIEAHQRFPSRSPVLRSPNVQDHERKARRKEKSNMHSPVEARWIVYWLGEALASPSALAMPAQLAAGTILALETASLSLLCVLTC